MKRSAHRPHHDVDRADETPDHDYEAANMSDPISEDDGDLPSEEELARMDRKISRYEARANEHERAGGAGKETAGVLLGSGVIGVLASSGLILSERHHLAYPDSHLVCDINPLIGCSKWMGRWQSEVFFGIPNALLGALFFAAIATLGCVLLTGSRLSRYLWVAALAGASCGIIWVLWFAYQSYLVEGSLCPYCVVVWCVTIPLFVHLLARTLQAGHIGRGAMSAGSVLVRNRWLIIGLIYALLIIFTVVWFWDSWALVL
ncbi:vitamin K epoxide reductase family protein [Trueperella sp. LYQ143]|uniref:vitamin K epoxide reductase family protein n=1 Tax=unclassified Trueperella TaxID=2630174 RepID=UPI0039835C6F